MSFEPNPIAFKHLKNNVAFNHFSNVSLYNVALGESDTTAGLTLCIGRTGGSRLISGEEHADEARDDGMVSVPVKTLDGCLGTDSYLTRNVDVIKIDAEGAETSICRGGNALLAHSHPYLMAEVDDGLLKRLGSSAQELLSYLHELDYVPYRVVRGGKLRPFNRRHQPTQQNLFFVPRGKPLL